MKVCESCGGLKVTYNFEMIAGTPCSCGSSIYTHGQVKALVEAARRAKIVLCLDGMVDDDGVIKELESALEPFEKV